jgi:hypothetical protein
MSLALQHLPTLEGMFTKRWGHGFRGLLFQEDLKHLLSAPLAKMPVLPDSWRNVSCFRVRGG